MSRGTCKLDDVVERYGVGGGDGYETVDDWLLARWLGEDGRDPVGYRTLARAFNKRVMKRVYDEHGRDAMGARLEGDYAALVGEDAFRREEVLADVAADGIDADRLGESLLSWGTVRTHLNECLGASKAPREAATDWERQSVDRAREHALETVRKAVGALASKDRVERADEADVEMPVLLSCPECPTRRPLEEAMDRGYVCREHLGQP